MRKFVRPGPRSLALLLVFIRFAVAGEKPSGQRAPWYEADALGKAERDHLALFFAIDQVVMILHGHKAGQPILSLGLEHLQELPCVHRRRAQIESFAGAHHITERFYCFLDRCLRVEAMNLVEVDIIDSKPLKAFVYGG